MTEAVASARRALPPGGRAQDHVFEGVVDGRHGPVTLSQLFGERDTLAIYSFMFGPERELPCPMCSSLLDGLDAVAEHVQQRLQLVVVAESPLPRLLAWAQRRPWPRLQLVSTAGNTYNRDYHGKTARGTDSSMLNVFHREGGVVRHFWGSEMVYAQADPGQDERGVDIIAPIFNLLDLTPAGRGEFYTELSYR